MGWFWGGRSGNEPSRSSEDIVERLDPSVRKILDSEKFTAPETDTSTGAGAGPASASAAERECERLNNERTDFRFNQPLPEAITIRQPVKEISSSPSTTRTTTTETSNPSPDPTAQSPPVVPRESLFPDGRYAHLWKTYQSYSTIESSHQTDQDRLRDIIDAHNDRKQSIGKAAVENCALEQVALSDCLRNGGWGARMVLCRTEQRRFDRCFVMQGKFLKALGYMAERPASGGGGGGGTRQIDERAEERLQMHADTLYHRMLEHEKLVEEAQKRGEEPPALVPVMSREGMAKALADQADPSSNPNSKSNSGTRTITDTNTNTDVNETLPLPVPIIPAIPALTVQDLPDDVQRDLRERLKGLSAEERALEIRLFEEEHHSKKNMTSEVAGIYEEEKMERMARRASGKETVGDRMKRWWGWN